MITTDFLGNPLLHNQKYIVFATTWEDEKVIDQKMGLPAIYNQDDKNFIDAIEMMGSDIGMENFGPEIAFPVPAFFNDSNYESWLNSNSI